MAQLEHLSPKQAVPYGGDQVTYVSEELAAAFQPGDRLVVEQDSGDLLHIPASVWATATGAVGRASAAFAAMGTVTEEQITTF